MWALSLAQRLNSVREGEEGKKKFFSAYSIRDILAGQGRRRAAVARHRPAAGGLATHMSFTSYVVGS